MRTTMEGASWLEKTDKHIYDIDKEVNRLRK